MTKAVILFSGGLDSTTCIAYAKNQGFECFALSFDYNQRHKSELIAATTIAQELGVSHQIFNLDMSPIKGSALTDPNIEVPNYTPNSTDIPITYVPARNTIFLSIALAYAETLQAKDIFIGVSAIDYSMYPDCRPKYIAAFQNLANLATKIGVEESGIKIHTPLINLSKAQTIEMGIKLGLDYRHTVSCYQLSTEGKACGICDSCGLRIKGFQEAGVVDPTLYVL